MDLRRWRGELGGEINFEHIQYRIAFVKLPVHERMKLSLAFVAASDLRLRSIESCIVLSIEFREHGSTSNPRVYSHAPAPAEPHAVRVGWGHICFYPPTRPDVGWCQSRRRSRIKLVRVYGGHLVVMDVRFYEPQCCRIGTALGRED
jgi:hypothetical protein